MSQSQLYKTASKIPWSDEDGDLDVQVDTSTWTDKKRWNRRLQYLIHVDCLQTMTTSSGLEIRYGLRFPRLPETPIIKAIRRYLQNGKLCVAQIPCTACIEINSCRPPGAPPFCCIIEAKPGMTKVRSDGSQICAYCYSTGRTSCHAWGAYDLRWHLPPETPESSIASESSDDSLFREAPELSDEASVDTNAYLRRSYQGV